MEERGNERNIGRIPAEISPSSHAIAFREDKEKKYVCNINFNRY